MTYRTSAKNRKMKAKLFVLIKMMRFRAINSSLSNKIILTWIMANVASLFLTWVESDTWTGNLSYNSFGLLLGYIGYIILLFDLFIIFVVVSNDKKELFKLNTSLTFRDYNVILMFSFLILLITFVALNFIKWLNVFSQSIIYWKWLIYSFAWWVIAFFWWVTMYYENKKNLENLYIENSHKIEEDEVIQIDNKNNMKLPF